MPAPGVTEEELANAAQLASLADETPEGRSIVVLAKQRFQLRERDLGALGATFIAFSAHTRMSGVDIGPRQIRKGASDAIMKQVEARRQRVPEGDPERRPGGGAPRQHPAAGIRRRTRARHH